uniref:Uncharacterized protein n=1 Tax=Arundo donax TaxID=35708 RepID=A0A0A8Y9T1_ARUDO
MMSDDVVGEANDVGGRMTLMLDVIQATKGLVAPI